jgi:chorismate mutase
MPADDEVIAALIGMPAKTWAKLGKVLLRGWKLADDGRLYHGTITERVLEMLDYRAKQAKRVADFKAKQREQREQRAANALPQREYDDSNDTGTGTGSKAIPSVAKATGGEPPVEKSEDREKRELYDAGKSLLAEQGMPAKQTGSFIAKLAKDYGQPVALEAVRSAVAARPMKAVEYLMATCQSLKGERRDPITVGSDAADKTAAYLAQQQAHGEAANSPEAKAAAAAALASLGVLRRAPQPQQEAN